MMDTMVGKPEMWEALGLWVKTDEDVGSAAPVIINDLSFKVGEAKREHWIVGSLRSGDGWMQGLYARQGDEYVYISIDGDLYTNDEDDRIVPETG